MTNYYPLAFNITHWHSIELRQWERDNVSQEMVEDLVSRGQLFTLMVDEIILAIVGYREMWRGVYEVYVIPSIYIPKYPILTIKIIRRSLDAIARSHGMRRQQTRSVANERSDKWMRTLGFIYEGTCKAYSANGEDFNMWARFNDVEVLS